jgi:UDP-N-acetylmuramyl pentapeptide synthase
MLELGEFSKEEHIQIAQYINELHPFGFIGVGNDIHYSYENVNTENKICIPDIETALNTDLTPYISEAEVIFIKGSRANQLEKLLEKFQIKQNA